jgi:hypothetical protein
MHLSDLEAWAHIIYMRRCVGVERCHVSAWTKENIGVVTRIAKVSMVQCRRRVFHIETGCHCVIVENPPWSRSLWRDWKGMSGAEEEHGGMSVVGQDTPIL